MSARWLIGLVFLGCTPKSEVSGEEKAGSPFPGLDEAPELRGSGGPARTFGADELGVECSTMMGGPEDLNFHNLVMPYRGHLVLPWAAEFGWGGLSFFDMADPCEPVRVGDSYHDNMRETHAIGFLHLPDEDGGRDYAAVNHTFGILIWDITDPSAPVEAASLDLDRVYWPDAYARVSFSVFWQYPILYVAAADNGIIMVDTTDPADPFEVARTQLEPGIRAGGIFVLGTEMLVVSAEQTEMALFDVSDPVDPQLHLGGRITIESGDGEAREAYGGNMMGDYALLARKDGGGGPMIFDISEPSAVELVGEYLQPDSNGGYIYGHEGMLFVGNTHSGDIYDATDPTQIEPVFHLEMEGDLDTLTPFGNIAVLSADDEAAPERSSVIVPWTAEPDARGPQILRTVPADGDEGVAVTARIGLGFDEILEPSSVFAGSLQVSGPDGEAVEGVGSAQETIATWSPSEPLRPNATYTVTVVEDGIQDLSGNGVAEQMVFTFSTGSL